MTTSSLCRNGALGLVLVLALVSTGCNQISDLSGLNSRFTFAYDDEGRLVRLNKLTGELTLVRSELSQPITRAPRTARPEATPEATSEAAAEAAPEAAPELVLPETTTEAASTVVAESETPLPTCSSADAFAEAGHIRVRSSSPIFVAPRQLKVPLVTMTAGSTLPVEDVANDWLKVRFEDEQWGPRVGFIHCSTVEVAPESDVVSTAAAR